MVNFPCLWSPSISPLVIQATFFLFHLSLSTLYKSRFKDMGSKVLCWGCNRVFLIKKLFKKFFLRESFWWHRPLCSLMTKRRVIKSKPPFVSHSRNLTEVLVCCPQAHRCTNRSDNQLTTSLFSPFLLNWRGLVQVSHCKHNCFLACPAFLGVLEYASPPAGVENSHFLWGFPVFSTLCLWLPGGKGTKSLQGEAVLLFFLQLPLYPKLPMRFLVRPF